MEELPPPPLRRTLGSSVWFCICLRHVLAAGTLAIFLLLLRPSSFARIRSPDLSFTTWTLLLCKTNVRSSGYGSSSYSPMKGEKKDIVRERAFRGPGKETVGIRVTSTRSTLCKYVESKWAGSPSQSQYHVTQLYKTKCSFYLKLSYVVKCRYV